MPLAFGNLTSGRPALLIGEAPFAEAEALSSRILASWSAFTTRGDPGWPAYDAEAQIVQLLDNPPSVATYPEQASQLLWQQHAFAALPLID